MAENEGYPQVPVRPARDNRAIAGVIKAVLIVATVAAAVLLLYIAIFIGIFAMAG